MSLEIKFTPILEGKDAERFLKEIEENKKISKHDRIKIHMGQLKNGTHPWSTF